MIHFFLPCWPLKVRTLQCRTLHKFCVYASLLLTELLPLFLDLGMLRLRDVAAALELTKEEVLSIFCMTPDGRAVNPAEGYQLLNRARHVYSEAERVGLFYSACDAKSGDTVDTLGKLMCGSHSSCKELVSLCIARVLVNYCICTTIKYS